MTINLGPSPDLYSAAYYGMDPVLPPTANYRAYGPLSVPHWSMPLARWLKDNAPASVLDCGAAFGHLCRDLTMLGVPAIGIEWSPFALANKVGPVIPGDARNLALHFGSGEFGTVMSLDFLEHFDPPETAAIMQQMVFITRPGGLLVHLVGAHNPDDDISQHMSDGTHRNHEPLQWYSDQFIALGLTPLPDVVTSLNNVEAWAGTDWVGRWIAFRKPVA